MSVHVTPEQLKRARNFVRKVKGPDGLARVDLDRFWAGQEKAAKDPWSPRSGRVPLGMARMSIECVWTELGEPEDWLRLTQDAPYRDSLARRYNDLSERVVGRRLLAEDSAARRKPDLPVKSLADIFESENRWEGQSYWLQQAAATPEELAALLDRVERRLEDLRGFLLPADWPAVKRAHLARGGEMPLYRGQRGPVTFAMSVFGVENLIYLIADNPALAGRFRDLILRAILDRARILDEEAGHTPSAAPRGWSWADDNCAMLNKGMYDFFARPILKAVFDRYAPGPEDRRYQHSDSDMAQHLPTLGALGLNGVNFGPNLTVTEIRRHLPKAVIQGQLAPFTFSRNEEAEMVAEFLRDLEMSREKRGLIFATAGSINDGSRLSGLRLLMAAAQEFAW
jgi:uroporphyrinogen decarboxylase